MFFKSFKQKNASIFNNCDNFTAFKQVKSSFNRKHIKVFAYVIFDENIMKIFDK